MNFLHTGRPVKIMRKWYSKEIDTKIEPELNFFFYLPLLPVWLSEFLFSYVQRLIAKLKQMISILNDTEIMSSFSNCNAISMITFSFLSFQSDRRTAAYSPRVLFPKNYFYIQFSVTVVVFIGLAR